MRRLSLIVNILAGFLSAQLPAAEVIVSNPPELQDAIRTAAAGDVILLSAGTYSFDGALECQAAATADLPVTVRGQQAHTVLLRFDTVEGFRVTAPGWVFEDLEVEGICGTDSACEHAFHLGGRADQTVIRRVKMHEFNAAIKGNGEMIGSTRLYPDDVLIEHCEIYNSAPRQTSNPVTPIDVVGGRRWTIRANFIHDHAKAGGNNISYAAFLKGHSRQGVFERNLVVCELLHTGQIRLGLSFGGGGSSPEFICEGGDCSIEHVGGIMRNNIVANCPADAGIYLNRASDARIFNNTLYNTSGIDVRFETSVATLQNNLLSGQIRERDGGTALTSNNLTQVSMSEFRAWFEDPDSVDFSLVDGTAFLDQGIFLSAVLADFCANPRDDGQSDIGALEYDGDAPCDTTGIPGQTGAVASEIFFAQFADGQGLSSQIVLSNPDAMEAATVFLLPRADEGQSLFVDWNGAVPSLPLTATVPPGGIRTFTTDGEGPLQSGSVSVFSLGPVSGVLIFSGPELGLAGVGSSARLRNGFSTPVLSDSSKDIRTGVALMNLEDQSVECGFQLLGPDGNVVAASEGSLASGTGTVSPLTGLGHFAVFPEDLLWEPQIDLSVFQGTVRVECNGEAAALAVQVRPGQYATLPVAPLGALE